MRTKNNNNKLCNARFPQMTIIYKLRLRENVRFVFEEEDSAPKTPYIFCLAYKTLEAWKIVEAVHHQLFLSSRRPYQCNHARSIQKMVACFRMFIRWNYEDMEEDFGGNLTMTLKFHPSSEFIVFKRLLPLFWLVSG